ncbi:MAG: hypothetical protein U1E83_11840 [Methylotetracoccus sp.]
MADGDAASARAQVALNALTQFGQARLTYALLYRGRTRGFWRDVYRTLRLVHGLTRRHRCHDPRPRNSAPRYSRLLGPNRLRQSEMREVFRMLSKVFP